MIKTNHFQLFYHFMKKIQFILLPIFISLTFFSKAQESTEIDIRVSELLSKMTLEEKISQLNSEYLIGIPRLNIPLYNWHNEALHGLGCDSATQYPVPIALAATFNVPLMSRIATAISDEGRVKFRQNKMGLNYWSPNMDLVRNPLWGRSQETYGEDPFLASKMGIAFIRGIQGDDPKYLKAIASPKHYAVHSGPELLRFKFNPITSQRDFWETYIIPFKAAITEGKSYSIMTAYNAYNGIPNSVNKFMIETLLRKKWGFEGYVTCDCGALSAARWNHGIFGDEIQTAAAALKAGLDLECGEYYLWHLPEAIRRGYVTEEDIDVPVFRLFKARYLLGLFDPIDSCRYNFIPDSIVEGKKHTDLSIEAACEAMVLLKNENKTLPLKKDLKSIYLIGPTAAVYWEMLGAYAGWPSKWTSVYDALKKKVSNETVITYDKGCEIMASPTELVSSDFLKTNDGLRGLRGEYFNNDELAGEPAFVRVDSVIDFIWDRISPITGSDMGEPFSIRWTGKLKAEYSAIYTLNLLSNDGARVYINGRKLIESWWDHGFAPFVGFDTLKAGDEYEIVIEYFFRQSYARVRFEWGCEFTCNDQIEEFVRKGKEADIVLFVGGISREYEGEMVDRQDFDFPRGQDRILRALHESGATVVCVFFGGSSIAYNWQNDKIPAILLPWYSGQEAGTGIVDVLFGDYNPAGRLPITFYKTEKDLPDFENYFMEGHTYRYFRNEPLYPFGYGLSYTTFGYSDLSLPNDRINICDTDTIDVVYKLKNNGDLDGDEVTQLYIVNLDSKLPQPIKELKGFKRRFIKAGEEITDTIKLVLKDIYYFDIDRQDYYTESGAYEIQIGASSQDIRLKGYLDLYNCLDTLEPKKTSNEDRIYPNPAVNMLNFNLNTIPYEQYNVKILNIMGKEMFIGQNLGVYGNNFMLNISFLPPGAYFIHLKGKSDTYIRKFEVVR